jgi:uncharacterized membrane protein YqjE
VLTGLWLGATLQLEEEKANLVAILVPTLTSLLIACVSLVAFRWYFISHTYGRSPFASTKGENTFAAFAL